MTRGGTYPPEDGDPMVWGDRGGSARDAFTTPPFAITFDPRALARFMPMYIVTDPVGRILDHGPMIGRIFAPHKVVGQSIFRLFTIRGPRRIADMTALRVQFGLKLQLMPRAAEAAELRLRGVALPVAQAQGVLLNLSFGVDITRAMQRFGLSDADFAPTDMTMELLYLAEANRLVVEELRALSQRLDHARQQAEEEAQTDALTGLSNRRACDSFLARICAEGGRFSLLHIDLDHFKEVNDTFGHGAGDQVLAAVARIIKRNTRAQDCVARIGGDEFVAIFPGLTQERRLRELGDLIGSQIKLPLDLPDCDSRISASMGLVVVEGGKASDPAEILALADHALYAAKGAGRGCLVWAADLAEE